MSIKRWAIANEASKELTGGILQNETPPPSALGEVVLLVPDSFRDEHPDNLQVNITGDGIELKPDGVVLASKKATREKAITQELYEEAQRQLPMPVLLRAITTIIGVLAKEGSITSADADIQTLLTTLGDMSSQLGFTPVQATTVLQLQKSLMDRKTLAVVKIDTIIADGAKTKKQKEDDIEKVKG